MKKEETKNVNKVFDKSFVVINNLIDKEFKECKSYNDSIENLKTIEKIFKKLNYIPNPDITMKLIDENLLLSETIKIIVNNDLDIITKGEINKIFDNDTIILIIESYCMMNNIKIQEYGEDNKEFEENIINYEGENIDIVKLYLNEISRRKLSTLSDESLELIRIRYGDDLTVPVNNKLTEEQRKKFYGSVMAQIKRLLENPDIKRRKVQKNEIEEKKIESTSIVENVQTKNNLVETNEEQTSEITKDDYINMIKLFKTSNFKQMMSNLGSKESIIISLRMGYIDGKYFSVDAIAEFLDIERDEVSKIIKEVLLNYKESVIKSIDYAIEVVSDEQNVLKNEKDIKEKKYRKF